MNEKVLLVKAKGDQKWSSQTLDKDKDNDRGLYYLIQFFIFNKEMDYIEFKSCCCIVKRLIRLKDIEKYGITREELSEDMIIV